MLGLPLGFFFFNLQFSSIEIQVLVIFAVVFKFMHFSKTFNFFVLCMGGLLTCMSVLLLVYTAL